METRTQRIRRCRKIAQRLGLYGMAKRIDVANACLSLGKQEASDATIRVIVSDIRWMRHYFDKPEVIEFRQAAE